MPAELAMRTTSGRSRSRATSSRREFWASVCRAIDASMSDVVMTLSDAARSCGMEAASTCSADPESTSNAPHRADNTTMRLNLEKAVTVIPVLPRNGACRFVPMPPVEGGKACPVPTRSVRDPWTSTGGSLRQHPNAHRVRRFRNIHRLSGKARTGHERPQTGLDSGHDSSWRIQCKPWAERWMRL